MEVSRPEYWSGYPFPSPGDLPNPRIEPRSPALQADSLPAEPQGKPKNTGVGSLSLLQQIFPTQGLNQGLLHCRQILCQLSYQGSPEFIYFIAHTKNSLKWILDHNLKVIKLLEENLGENLNLEIVPPKKLMRKKTWFIWILNYCSLKKYC